MAEPIESNVTKAVRCELPLGQSVLNAYMLPNGEKRIGIEKVGIALGYSEEFFFTRTKRNSKALKALQEMGFSGKQIWVRILGEDGDITEIEAPLKTISVRDFVKLVTYEALIIRNVKALVLLASFAETGLERILEDVFAGRSVDFILEKIVHYSKWTYEELEEVLAYNREDVKALYAWGNHNSFNYPPSL
ncbi:hypothetical protein [Aerosakkonema funiforme]|uniref:hypothetical protein n=1 Tax=Aerosakkonema funiforme TaxID=1246630 RepID=UPI0035B7B3DD